MFNRVVLRGPLGAMAKQIAAQGGVDAVDVYATVLCWWSASIAPASSIGMGLMKWPTPVWALFATDDRYGQSSLLELLNRSGAQEQPLRSLPAHEDVSEDKEFSKAAQRTWRAERRGATTRGLLLTGSPFRPYRGRLTMDMSLESILRQAWDGPEPVVVSEYPRPRRAVSLSVGAMWEVDRRDWHAGTVTMGASTYSRMLHLVRRAPSGRTKTMTQQDAAWSGELESAYHWVFQEEPTLQLDHNAAAKLHPIRVSMEDAFEGELPEWQAMFFVRIGGHCLRIAAALAAAEQSDTIRGVHVESAWTLARRACLDTTELIGAPFDLVEQTLANVDATVEGTTGTDEVIPFTGDRWVHRPQETGRTLSANKDDSDRSRDTAIVQKLKQWYGHRCQICSIVLTLPNGAYSEGAHIKAFGRDNGPDRLENLLCLCPNCHILFDNGARHLTDELEIIDSLTGRPLGPLTVHPWHRIDRQYVRSHRQRST